MKTIAAALARAQMNMGKALKQSANPAFRSKYADLASVMAACLGRACCSRLFVWPKKASRYRHACTRKSKATAISLRKPRRVTIFIRKINRRRWAIC